MTHLEIFSNNAKNGRVNVESVKIFYNKCTFASQQSLYFILRIAKGLAFSRLNRFTAVLWNENDISLYI